MNEFPLLKDLIILLAFSLPISFLFHKLDLPAIVGFLITGMIIGPYGARLIPDSHVVSILAEIGVVILMFTIGLEFSLTRIMQNLHLVIGGGLQIFLTGGAVYLLSILIGYPPSLSLFFGFLFSLSSTAIVLKMYSDRGEIDSPHGKLSTAILLFQDLCVVPMILLIPIMANTELTSYLVIALTLTKAIIAVIVIFISARLLVPRILYHIVSLRSREFLVLFVILLCLGTAWLTHMFGLSLALGAFIAGLIISESEYSFQIVVDILPFRDYFSSIFFTSVGMLLHLNFFVNHWIYIIGITAGVIFLKGILVFITAKILRFPLRTAIITGLSLAQVGEFSFLLAEQGKGYGLIQEELYQTFLASAILSMLLAPLLIRISSELSFKIQSIFSLQPEPPERSEETPISNHVIIAGYGLNGQNLSRVLKETGIPFLVLDINGERVKQVKSLGLPILYGDITHREILSKAGAQRAKMIVFAISDPMATRRGVLITRQMNPDIYIMVRTRYASEVEELYHLGANQVIPEEYETSIEIFSRVLKEYHTPHNIIDQQVELIRMEGYGMLRGLSISGDKLRELSAILATSITDTCQVQENSPAANKSLKELDLRRKTGATVIAIIRGKKAITNPDPEFIILAGDMLVLLGRHAELDKAICTFRTLGEP